MELQLESTSAAILLIFIIPLAFTLSGFLLWIMYSLNGRQSIHGLLDFSNGILATIAHLRARKQRYKLKMFERLYYILLTVVVVIAIFFVISSMSFSGRFAEGWFHSSPRLVCFSLLLDYAANTWRTRWWLLDGYLALLYLASFCLIIFLWRPSENNRRYVFHFIIYHP